MVDGEKSQIYALLGVKGETATWFFHTLFVTGGMVVVRFFKPAFSSPDLDNNGSQRLTR